MKAVLLLFLLLTSCAKHVTPTPIVSRGTYFYWEIRPNVYGILAQSEQALRDALRELGCVNTICTVQESGRRFFVERFPE